MNNHNEWLRSIGLTDIANRNEKNFEKQEYELKLRSLFNKAEQLSKDGKPKMSNDIIYRIIENEKPDATAPMYLRIAINHRKLQEYQEEKDILERFLKYEQPRYGGDMWIEKFEDRLNKVNKKLN